jgi:formylglycine-generating enzyme
MVLIPGGTFVPLYRVDTLPANVSPFHLDVLPVSNADYLTFVKENPEWARENTKAVFADRNYLRHLTDGYDAAAYDPSFLNQPVTNVSWFAARAYCAWQGKRLPGTHEWEWAARASETQPDGSIDPGFYQRMLNWYSRPTSGRLDTVGSTFKNYYGVYDMHGLVWEWVNDFQSTILTGESRTDKAATVNLFCGAGASSATAVDDYVAFMRYAFRSSLKAAYTVRGLGFRCAQSLPQ